MLHIGGVAYIDYMMIIDWLIICLLPPNSWLSYFSLPKGTYIHESMTTLIYSYIHAFI